MIRINLLPSDKRPRKRKKAAQKVPAIILGLIASLLVALILSGVGVYLINKKVKLLTNDKVQKTAKLEGLKQKIKEVEAMKKKIDKVEANKKAIEELRANQSIPVRVIDEVSKALPENVWIKLLTLNGSNLALEGVAMTNDDVVVFVNNFKRSELFKDTYLVKSLEVAERGEKDTIKVYSFGITMIVVKPEAKAAEIKS
ncbi:MAG: PilN domain-containing protein [Candidatus Magnetobacterium sp. LHC-1]|uniref:PilN domain-containing protein n=1 Tax=Candidatus Magnetobacterium casense TaxID=1455061 RepID=A0ABS6RWD0_9BACT|nr:PilN domain-containing protein [Candidatus Magnetobacterium casensis]MBF0608628.1 PilN domain-containing protein [Nitrospirota bacterium]MBV6340568.1 PilN domain-containing protein [Candidatus Magnetobacterium casensis]